jgi:hypothetical protein
VAGLVVLTVGIALAKDNLHTDSIVARLIILLKYAIIRFKPSLVERGLK